MSRKTIINRARMVNTMCGNKRKFLTAKDADKEGRKMARNNKFRKPGTVHSYYCPYCLHWHLGHTAERKTP